MDFDHIKIEPSIMIKEEILNDSAVLEEVGRELEKNSNFEVKLEMEEKAEPVQEIVLEEFVIKEPFNEEDLHTCSHCGDRKSSEEMVQPEAENKLICRSHFDDEFRDSRHIYNVMKTKMKGTRKCCYCGKSADITLMTSVRKNACYFAKWVEILGNRFGDQFQKNNSRLICRTHFNIKWQRKRPKELLPVADLSENSTEVKLEGNQPIVTDDIAIIRILEYICVYCGESKCYRDLTNIPHCLFTLKKWGFILGLDFYKNALAKKSKYICRSHFNVKWRFKRPNSIFPCIKSAETKIFEINATHNENIVRKMYLEKKARCGYCGDSQFEGKLTQVPSNPNTLKQWGDILGEEFYETAAANQRTFICRSHFDVEWKHYRPHGLLPHVKLVKTMSKEVKEELLEDPQKNCSSEIKSAYSSIDDLSVEVKVEGPDEDFEEQHFHLLSDNIKLEKSDQKTEAENNPTNNTIQYKCSGSKKMKMEVKEESGSDFY